MDENKRQKLHQIGYQIRQSCFSCMYADLNGKWGTCRLHHYEHLKHSDPTRNLSINAAGWCRNWKMREEFRLSIHGFKEFMEK